MTSPVSMPPGPLQAFSSELAAIGGRVTGTWNEGAATLATAETRGLRHVFGFVPFGGTEHHVVVPFSLRSTIVLAQHEGAPCWFAGQDEALAGWLRGHATIAAATARLSWIASLAPGAPPLQLDWAVQLRPLGGTAGHLAMRVGDYGGRTGLGELCVVVDALHGAIGAAVEPHAAQAPLASSLFADAAARALGIPTPSVPPPPMQASFVAAGGGSISRRDAGRLVDAIAAQAPVAVAGGIADREAEHSRRVNAAGRAFLRGKTDEYIAIWESILRDLPDVGRPGEALYSLGSGHYAKKDWQRALQHYEMALQAGYHDVAETQKDIATCRRKMGM